jgi:hypothetical protein
LEFKSALGSLLFVFSVYPSVVFSVYPPVSLPVPEYPPFVSLLELEYPLDPEYPPFVSLLELEYPLDPEYPPFVLLLELEYPLDPEYSSFSSEDANDLRRQ